MLGKKKMCLIVKSEETFGISLWVDKSFDTVPYTHLRAHETREHLVCRLLLEIKTSQSPRFPVSRLLSSFLSSFAATSRASTSLDVTLALPLLF